MLRLSKLSLRTLPIAFTLVALVLAGGITKLQADPLPLDCSVNTITLPGGVGTVPVSALGPGVCVLDQDKLFGNFALGANFPTGAIVLFSVSSTGPLTENHTMAFFTGYAPGVYTPSFTVQAISPAVITAIRGTFQQAGGGPTTLVQTTNPAGTGTIDLTATGPFFSGTNQVNFTPAETLVGITSMFTVGPGSDANGLSDTFVEQIPEPASLTLLGIALAGFGIFGLRRKHMNRM